MKSILYLLFGSFFFISCKAQKKAEILPENPNNNTLLWKISGNGLTKPSYLFGTFHMMCKDDIHLSDNLKKAIQYADEVYFEMDLDDPTNTLGALLFMNMNDGLTLKDLYTYDEYMRLDSFFKKEMKMPLVALEKYKPTMIQAMLYPRLMNCDAQSGMETEILALAQKDKKEIKGFETIQDQAGFFDAIPYEVQARDLLKSIDSLEYMTQMFDSMVVVYKSQELESMDKMFDSEEITSGENRAVLLDKRNQNWVNILKEVMPKKGLFIAVGAGHLPGEMGVINLLKKEGFTVKPIKN